MLLSGAAKADREFVIPHGNERSQGLFPTLSRPHCLPDPIQNCSVASTIPVPSSLYTFLVLYLTNLLLPSSAPLPPLLVSCSPSLLTTLWKRCLRPSTMSNQLRARANYLPRRPALPLPLLTHIGTPQTQRSISNPSHGLLFGSKCHPYHPLRTHTIILNLGGIPLAHQAERMEAY